MSEQNRKRQLKRNRRDKRLLTNFPKVLRDEYEKAIIISGLSLEIKGNAYNSKDQIMCSYLSLHYKPFIIKRKKRDIKRLIQALSKVRIGDPYGVTLSLTDGIN